jgi:hypothetical protein
MRFTEFKLTRQPGQLNEGYTKGDLAESVWGAAVTAAFAKFPNAATIADVVNVISNLDQSLTYRQTRNDGLKSELTDSVVFKNIINMKAHIDDLRDIKNSIKKIDKEIPGILSDANNQVKTAGLELKEIFANGKADSITVGAEGGADQKGTKVDVSIVHADNEGNKEVKRLGYSLKTDTAATGIMPVSQAPGVNKGSGGQVEFFADLGILDDIDDASLDAYNELDAKLRKLVDDNASNGKLDSVYEKELRAIRRDNEGVQAFNKNIIKAANQINQNVETDGEEAAFFDDVARFLTKHINKNEPGIKLLTFDKNGAYTSTIEQFQKNVRNIKIQAVADTKRQSLLVNAIHEDGSKDLIFKIRFKASGGRFSGSMYKRALKKKSVKDGKEKASGYELLRYTLMVETGPGYKKAATVG